MVGSSMVSCEGTVIAVTKKKYCFYVTIFETSTNSRLEWVVEPDLWYRGPMREIAPGQMVSLKGRKEIPAVSVRGMPSRPARFRASRRIEIVSQQRHAVPAASSSSCPISVSEYRDKRPYVSTHLPSRQIALVESAETVKMMTQQNKWTMESIVQHVRQILEHPPKKIRLISKGAYQCFSVDLLHEHLPFIPEQDLSRCVTQMVRDGDAANVSVPEALYTLVTFHDFLAPSLLMILHGFRMCRSVPDDDGAFYLDEWIEMCLRKFCNRLNVPKSRLYESAKRLVEQGLAIVNENGKYRRPLEHRTSSSSAAVARAGLFNRSG